MKTFKGFRTEARSMFSLTPEEKTYTKRLKSFVKGKTKKIPRTKKQIKSLGKRINFRNYFD